VADATPRKVRAGGTGKEREPMNDECVVAAAQFALSKDMQCLREQQLAARTKHCVEGIPRVVDLLKGMATARHYQSLPHPPNGSAVSAEPRRVNHPGHNLTNAQQSAP
jgi:hypothetical protein